MAKSRFTDQTVLLPAWSETVASAGVQGAALTEAARKRAMDVKAHGLSEDDYIAVVPTELGVAGILNRNDRIYPSARFMAENARLAADIKRGVFSASEGGHPDAPATLNVAARLIEVTMEDAQGRAIPFAEREVAPVLPTVPTVVKAVGKIAFLKTRVGEDLWTLYKAGMPLGMSSVSYGEAVPQKIEADSPIAKDNPGAVGKSIDIIEGQDLVRYDVVLDPSASTYLRASEAAARTAYESLREQITTLPPIQQLKEAAAATSNGGIMDLKTLKAEHPDLFKQIVAEALAEADVAAPIAAKIRALPVKEQTRIGKVLAAVLPEGAQSAALGAESDDALVAAIRQEVAPLRERQTALEAKVKDAESKVKVAEDARKAAEKVAEEAKAEIAKRDLREKIGGAVKVAVEAVHKNLRAFVNEEIAPRVADGSLATPEAAEAEVKRLAAFAEKVSNATARATEGNVPPTADRGVDPGEGKGDKTGGSVNEATEDPILAALGGEYTKSTIAG